MTKTLNQIFFFPPPKSEYFFQQHWESEYFFRKKTYPRLQVKWSFPYSLEVGRWFSPGTLGTKNKTDLRDITKILLKVALNAMTIILSFLSCLLFFYETNWDMNYNLLSPLEWWSRQIS
jgi:hypothetical protein